MKRYKQYHSKFNYDVLKAMLQEKLVAAHCGLIQYGRNNIAYNDEFGSYFGIGVYFSDIQAILK